MAQNKLNDAFGAISLEIVTAPSCSAAVLLQLLKAVANCEQAFLKVVIRQISFYHGKDRLKQLCADSTGNDEDLKPLRQEFQALGYIV
jgi:hypothetical protein